MVLQAFWLYYAKLIVQVYSCMFFARMFVHLIPHLIDHFVIAIPTLDIFAIIYHVYCPLWVWQKKFCSMLERNQYNIKLSFLEKELQDHQLHMSKGIRIDPIGPMLNIHSVILIAIDSSLM